MKKVVFAMLLGALISGSAFAAGKKGQCDYRLKEGNGRPSPGQFIFIAEEGETALYRLATIGKKTYAAQLRPNTKTGRVDYLVIGELSSTSGDFHEIVATPMPFKSDDVAMLILRLSDKTAPISTVLTITCWQY